MAATWLRVLLATSKKTAGSWLPCGIAMGYLGRLWSPCQPLYSQMGISTPSVVPTSLRTTRVSY